MVMRIGGIASGLDTEQMVRDLMRVERMKVDKFFRQEEALKWQRDALNTTNKTLADFILKARSNMGLTRTTNTGVLLSNSAQNFDWVKKVSSGDEDIIKATAVANAMEGTYKIKVEQLAEVASVISGDLKDILDGDRFNWDGDIASFEITTAIGSAEIKLENAKVTGEEVTTLDFSIKKDEEGNITENNSLTLRINGKQVKLEEEFGNIEDLAVYIQGAIGEAEESGVKVINEDGKLTFRSKNNITIESSTPDPGEEGKLKLETKLGLQNGITKANNSINNVVKQINNAVDEDGKNLGLRAAYDANLGKLMITTKEQGADQIIKISATEGNLASEIFGAENDVLGENGVTGKDAEIKFNGDEITQSSNNFSIFGVNYQLQSAEVDKIVTIKVETDVNGIFDKVKEFVDDYNELVDHLNGLLNEKSYRDFQPLTKEEKEAMKEKEIELWEEKAKSGLLRNDETISRVLQTMRDGLYGNVYDGWTAEMGESGAKEKLLAGFHHITQIGITTGNYQSGGRLEINEEKLREAIIEDSEGVINLLFKTSDINVPSENTEEARKLAAEKRANSGLVDRLFNDMIIGMKEIVRRAGIGEDANILRDVKSNMLIDFVTSGSISVMDRDIMNIGKRIATEEMRLIRREDRYWSQFTAMEKALEQMNQQSAWLMSQLGQMGR
ncbi:MAG: flagellar filament capping protein FliD [Candidatus Alkaliphilus sp. MAG34]